MSVQLTDGTTQNVVDTTSKGILVQNPKVVAQTGFAAVAALRDSGSVTGSVNAAAGDVSPDLRLRVGIDTQLFFDQFNYTAQNSSMYSAAQTTMTITWSAGFATINANADVTSGHNAVLKTYRTFPLYNEGAVLVHVKGYYTGAFQANANQYFGLGIPGTTAAPTDGVYWQVDATGALRGVCNWNGTTTQTPTLTAPSTSVAHDWKIIIDDQRAEFWIDNVLQGVVALPSGAATPSMAGSAQWFYQAWNSGTVGTAVSFHLQNISIELMDQNSSKPWPHIMAGSGLMSYQGQNGGTLGTTSNIANSAFAAASILSNTAVGTGNPAGLGGYSHDLCTLAAGTDGIVTSYQNPAGSISITPRNLYITGVNVMSVVDSTLTGGPLVFVYTLAYGHTAVSLATTTTTIAKAPVRVPIGCEGCAATAAAGTLLSPAGIGREFTTPILVQPGEFVAVVARNVGTVASLGSVIHIVSFDGYWE